MKKEGIKLIILDCYGIILSCGYPDTVGWLCKKFGIPKDKLYNVIYTKYFNLAALGKISQPQAWQLSTKELNLPLSWRKLHQTHIGLLKINKPAYDLAKELSLKYKVVILSKNTRMQMTATKRKFPQLAKDFKIINTHDINLPKASAQTILYLLKKFKVKPTEILYADDQESNLVAARKMGVKTIFYRNFNQFKKELMSYIDL